MNKKILIVGSVAGGATAAARLRRLDESARIIMFERDEYISFANCGMPYYIGGIIKNRSNLFVQTPQKIKNELDIDIRIFSEVTAVDTKNKIITVNSREKGIYQENYDNLILAPGAKPIKPPIPGINNERILSLRNIYDTDLIKSWVDSKKISRVTIVGGGFIGVEMAENLKVQGLDINLVEAAPHILAPFDSDMSSRLEKELTDNGINLILEDGVQSFTVINEYVQIKLTSGKSLGSDLVILAIGVTPDTGFLKGSNIDLGPKGHIIVNEHMETSEPSVYAVGDAIELTDCITDYKTAVPLAGPANRQARIAADNIAGIHSVYSGVIGSAIIKVFDLTAAVVGSNERTLARLAFPYKAVSIHAPSHASYYPGAMPILLKVIFNKENGCILGAQGIGTDGIDKRIDVIAAVIKLKGTIHDLADLELCYAPPFSSARDPVNIAGYVAENTLAGISSPISYAEYLTTVKDSPVLLDVRSKSEFKDGHLENAVNIPLDTLRKRINELNKQKSVVTYCKIGRRSYLAERILMQKGYSVSYISGGYQTITDAGYLKSEKD